MTPITGLFDPKNNYIFQQIFGTEKNKDLMLHFLNSVLEERLGHIEDIKYINTEKILTDHISLVTRVDIECTSVTGHKFIVEMQKSRDECFLERCLIYVCLAVVNQFQVDLSELKKYLEQDTYDPITLTPDNKEETEKTLNKDIQTPKESRNKNRYSQVKDVHIISILDYSHFTSRPNQYISRYSLSEEESNDRDIKIIGFTFLELKKYEQLFQNKKPTNDLERWMYFLSQANISTRQIYTDIIDNDITFLRAYEQLQWSSYSAQERQEIFRIQKAIDKEIGERETAINDAREEGREAGLAEGMEKGREVGLAEGMERGAKQNAIENAKAMLADGMSIEMVMKYSGLSRDEVEVLTKDE